jgi:CheY-like chemotaxis protein
MTTIAIVDDDPVLRRALGRLLSANGYRSETFGSAEEFLLAAATSKVACIIVDINLGDTSGLELVRQLFRSGLKFPVIFISGVEDETITRRAHELGCMAFMRAYPRTVADRGCKKGDRINDRVNSTTVYASTLDPTRLILSQSDQISGRRGPVPPALCNNTSSTWLSSSIVVGFEIHALMSRENATLPVVSLDLPDVSATGTLGRMAWTSFATSTPERNGMLMSEIIASNSSGVVRNASSAISGLE